MTKRSAVWVAEKAATLLSIRPAAFATSRISFVAEGGRLPLSRDDPDRAVRTDAGGQHRERLEVGGCLGAEQDHVGLGLGLALGQVGGPLCDEPPDLGVVDVDQGDAHPRADPELVEQRRGVDPFHRRYRAMRCCWCTDRAPRRTTSGPGIR